MKVLWIAYQPLNIILEDMNRVLDDSSGGWLEGASEQIRQQRDLDLVICFPNDEIIDGKIDGISYHSVHRVRDIHFIEDLKYKKSDYKRFKKIVNEEKPDIIHIFGTEKKYQRDYIMMSYDMGLIDRTIVWIQGLVTICSESYGVGLEIKQIRRKSIWELIRGTNIEGIRKRLALNGRGEVSCIEKLKYVFVRTEWDYACCKAFNPNIVLLKCNETLRKVFYEDIFWNVNSIERHSIFISQWSTPIKGFHILIKAVAILRQKYPDIVIYTTGESVYKKKGVVSTLREPSYNRIVREMIDAYNLKNHIKFLGRLSSLEMRNRYVKANVAVLASTIENSPNSLGEAMMVGTPIVAAMVGGVSSMIQHEKEGFLYPSTEYTLLAQKIDLIFDNDILANELSFNARKRAAETHDRDLNYINLLKGYQCIYEARK